jgi:hypothetical protein
MEDFRAFQNERKGSIFQLGLETLKRGELREKRHAFWSEIVILGQSNITLIFEKKKEECEL